MFWQYSVELELVLPERRAFASAVPDSAATTVAVSTGVIAPDAIVLVVSPNPNIPFVEGASFHSLDPIGEDPSSGYELVSTWVACLPQPVLAKFYHHIFFKSYFVI